jgi:hypothetical protein
MTDTLNTKTAKAKPIVWTHDDDPKALAESIVNTIQHAQQVLILVEDGSVIFGNAIDGFDWRLGDKMPEQAMIGLGSTMRSTCERPASRADVD